MKNTVIHNGVSYDVDRIILIKGSGARITVPVEKQICGEDTFVSDKTKFPVVVPNGDNYCVLIKPQTPSRNPEVVHVISKFVLKKIKDQTPSKHEFVPSTTQYTQPPNKVPDKDTSKLTGIELLRAKFENNKPERKMNSSRTFEYTRT